MAECKGLKAWLFLSLLSFYSRLIIYSSKTRLTGFHLVLEDMGQNSVAGILNLDQAVI